MAISVSASTCQAGEDEEKIFRTQIQPLLESRCYDCHGHGTTEGGLSLDGFSSAKAAADDPQLWWRVLKMVRAGLMPPTDHSELSDKERDQLEAWIKAHVFEFNPQHPDPGDVTLRRLNRIEYRNTIRDLLGVDYDTELHFPPEDTGHGFDRIGEVLNISQLHLEKYIQAAKTIASQAVPLSSDHPGHDEFFGGPIPSDSESRRALAERLLESFASRAYRRPIDSAALKRIADLAEHSYSEGGNSFESAIADAHAAVLASPRFLFLVEEAEPNSPEPNERLDEFSLASRLSYLLWSTMPDEELLRLAGQGKLRANFADQLQRMLRDRRTEQFVSQFVGQWLRSREIPYVTINIATVLRRDEPPAGEFAGALNRYWQLAGLPPEELNAAEHTELANLKQELENAGRLPQKVDYGAYANLRSIMKRETEMQFAYVLSEDRSLLELLDCDYAFLNEQLANHYGIEGVEGSHMRRVELPADSPRGGILTQGTMLVMTSNPDRTSPVKRGLYILENVLGTPPAPPPSDVPELEDRRITDAGNAPTLRESLARHREDPLCSSCHNRMDPLGLALENFNALGGWRDEERGQKIDPSGTLITGEQFENVHELKTILVVKHRLEFYRCLTEKLLTFAIGRGLGYHDVQTVDAIVAQLEESGGKPSVLLNGIIESAPFQMRRRSKGSPPATLPAQVSHETSP